MKKLALLAFAVTLMMGACAQKNNQNTPNQGKENPEMKKTLVVYFSATGTANAALTHYLQQNGRIPSTGDFSFLQGEAMGRPSVIATRITGDGVIYVGGTATIVAKGELMV